MKIESGCVVGIDYEIRDTEGALVETSEKVGLATFLIDSGAIIPGLDEKLVGLETGADVELTFSAEEAFGTTESAPTRDMPRGEFPEGDTLKPGDAFEAAIQAHSDQKVRLLVEDIQDAHVTVKIIHPLADQDIAMKVQVRSVRAATERGEAGRQGARQSPAPTGILIPAPFHPAVP